MHSSPPMSSFQLVPTRGAELLWITASHDLLLAEHTLHTVGGGGKGAQDLKYKKNQKIFILPSVREIAIVIEVTWNKAASDIKNCDTYRSGNVRYDSDSSDKYGPPGCS